MRPVHGLSLSLAALMLLSAPAITSGQAPPAAAQKEAISYFVAKGPASADDIARLRAELAKLPGVGDMEIVAHAGGVTLRIKGTPAGRLLAVHAKTVGFDLRTMPLNEYLASSGSATDFQRLQDALGKVEGVEQVDISGPLGAATVRVLGDVKAAVLASAAKSVGFNLRRTGYFAASGSIQPADTARLRATLEKVAGVSQVEMRSVDGGTMLGVRGVMEDEVLAAAAKSSGYELRPMVDPGGGPFIVPPRAASWTKRSCAPRSNRFRESAISWSSRTPLGTELTLPISVAKPQTVIAVAQSAGFDLRPVYPFFEQAPGVDMERNTPPASNDRILEDLTKVGDLAPDFTLITKDGKSKVTLSDFRGKKPVVLIFGSYT